MTHRIVLQSGSVYRFSITMRTPFAGKRVVARACDDGFDLYTLDEWATLREPSIRLDARGRLLYQGRTTGYRQDVLLETGERVE